MNILTRTVRAFERLGQRWKRFTLRGFEAEPSTVRKRHINLFWSFTTISIGIFIVFGLDHTISSYGSPLMGKVYLAAAGVLILNLWLLRRTRRFNLARGVFFIVLMACLEILLTTGGILQAGILWFFIFPPIAFFLTGRQAAIRLIALLYALTAGLYLLDAYGYLEIPYAVLTLRQFALSFLLVSLLIYFQERGRERDERLLVESEGELRRSFENLQSESRIRTAAEEKLQRRTRKLLASNRSLETTKAAMVNILEDLEETQGQLEQRNALMHLVQTVAVAANDARSADQAYETALAEICTYLGWPIGHALKVTPAGTITSSGVWYLSDAKRFQDFRKGSEALTWAIDEGLPGYVYQQQQPVWIPDIQQSEIAFPRRGLAERSQIGSFIAFPIFAGHEITAIIEVMTTEVAPEDPTLLKALGNVGTVLGRVAERERTAAELKHLATLVESSTDAVIGKDTNGIIVSWNKGAEQIYGYSAREMVGQSISALVPRDRKDEVELILSQIKAGQRVDHYDTERLTKAGQRINVSLTISPIRDSRGKVIGASTIARDVTKQKQIEQMKTDFVSLVSHQLKTPAGEIRGYAENMLNGVTGELTDKQREYIERVLSISIENYDLVADLLNVSKLERGIVDLNVGEWSLMDIVTNALRDYETPIKRKGLTLKVNRPRQEIRVTADRAKMGESLRNVINNALKYTDRGSITVSLSKRGQKAYVTVTDTGGGIPAEIQANLFTRHQVLSGRPHAGGGAGIGLYIAKNFMNLQGGDIEVKSGRGKGSTFTFSIPLARTMMKKATRRPVRRRGKQTKTT